MGNKTARDSEILNLIKTAPAAVDETKVMTSQDWDTEVKHLSLANKQEKLLSKRQNRRQRGIFSICIFGFVCLYMLIALLILVLVGSNVLSISDGVMISLLTTTTANVIGIFAMVVRYLFYHKD